MSTPDSPPPRTSTLITTALALALALSGGCGEAFHDAHEYDEGVGSESDDPEDEDDGDDDDAPPSVHTSTSGSGADTSESLSSGGTSTREPPDDDPTTSGADVDEPPQVLQPEVQGSHAPAPITAAGPVTLSVVALDDHHVDRVEFLINDAIVATVTDHEYGRYAHALSIDHQDDAGAYTFQARAVDSAGQTTASGVVPWTVELPAGGAVMINEPNEPIPGEHVYWEDVAVSPTGELYVIGRRIKDGVVTLLSERRGPSGALIDDTWINPVPGRFGVAAAFMDSTLIVVARDVDGSSWIGRYLANGALMYQRSQDDVEWRDVAVGDGRVFVVGNTGALADVGTVNARTWALTPTLVPFWVRTETAGGDKNVARAIAVADGRIFAVGHVTYDDIPGRYGAAWAYSTGDGSFLWSREFPKESEDLADITVLPDGLRTAGFWDVDGGQRMVVRHLQVENGVGVPINILAQTHEVERAQGIAATSHGEYVVAGTRCTGGECFAQGRRYAGNTNKWTAEYALKSPASGVVAAASLPYGYVALIGQQDVDYGNGDQGSSWLRVIHP